MAKKINPDYRAAYRKVLAKAANDEIFRKKLLDNDKAAAEQAMTTQVGIDAALSEEIANSIYKNNSKYRTLHPDAKSLIRLMAYVFGNLPASGLPATMSVPRGLPGDSFDDNEDWENFWT